MQRDVFTYDSLAAILAQAWGRTWGLVILSLGWPPLSLSFGYLLSHRAVCYSANLGNCMAPACFHHGAWKT